MLTFTKVDSVNIWHFCLRFLVSSPTEIMWTKHILTYYITVQYKLPKARCNIQPPTVNQLSEFLH